MKFNQFLAEGKGQKVWAYTLEERSDFELANSLNIFATEKDCVAAIIKDLKNHFTDEQLDHLNNHVDTLQVMGKYFDKIKLKVDDPVYGGRGKPWDELLQAEVFTLK